MVHAPLRIPRTLSRLQSFLLRIHPVLDEAAAVAVDAEVRAGAGRQHRTVQDGAHGSVMERQVKVIDGLPAGALRESVR